MRREAKRQTTIRLSVETLRDLDRLADFHRVQKGDVIEMLVAEAARELDKKQAPDKPAQP